MTQTGDCMRKYEKIGEIMPLEVGCGTVLAKRALEDARSPDSSKRRKSDSNADRDQLLSQKLPEDSASPATSEALNCVPVSGCPSADLSDLLKHESRSVDLEVELHAGAFETEISTHINCRFSGETIPSNELCADTDDLESSAATKPSGASLSRKHQAAKMPPAAEIEEFFTAAEKGEQKRFADKYNYDIVKDVPLEGRYQWVRLKP